MAKSKNTVNFNDVLTELKQGKIRDLYILEGEDEYLKAKIISALDKLLIEPSSQNLDKIIFNPDGKASEKLTAMICDELSSPSFMSKRKLIIVKNSGYFSTTKKSNSNSDNESEKSAVSGDNKTGIEDILSHVSDSSCIVFVEEKIDKRRKSMIESINKIGIIADITKPDQDVLRNWVKKEFKRNGVVISRDAVDVFIERNDRNLLSMENEAQKLILYAKYSNLTEVTSEEIVRIGTTDLKESIFNLFDAVSDGNAGVAFDMLDNLISQKQPVQLIFFMFARHIRQLICANEISNQSKIASIMKVPPFVASKLFKQSKELTGDMLESMYENCHEADVAIKTSKITDRIALEILIADLTDRIKTDKLIKTAF